MDSGGHVDSGGNMRSYMQEAVCCANAHQGEMWNGSYHDIEGGDHVEGGGKYGTHGLHRWFIQAVIGRQDLAV